MLMQKLLAWVRKLSVPAYSEGEPGQPIASNPRGELIVAQGMPELAELVRLGQSWQTKLTTGLAALTALPTTTAGLSLYNGDTDAYAIDAFGSVEEVIDATQADTTAILAMNNLVSSVSTPPTDAALAINGLSGRKYDGYARTVSGATVVNDGWFAHGQQAPLAPAVAGANWKVNEVLCRGLYVVKPGGQFNIVAVKAGAAAAAQQFYFVRWHKIVNMPCL